MRSLRVKSVIIVLLLWIVFSFCGCGKVSNESTFNIQFIDVGQGDSALVECDGHYMLIDGGDSKAADKVYSVLEEKNIKHLDILVASHLHEDHIGGLWKPLTYASEIDLTLSTSEHSDSEHFSKFSRELGVNGAEITIPTVGDKYKLGSAEIEIIDIGSSGNESIVMLITYGETTFLFTGDMEHNMEERLCDKYEDELPVTLLKVAHHGSDTSTSIRFLRMLMPQYAVISVGENNRYGHPHEQTISRLEQADVTYFRTDFDGDISVKSDGKKVTVKTSR